MAKYVFITGGVASGLGKGITAASLGRLLKARGYNVTLRKFDPYYNVDSSNLSPYQHGEIFVTEDGAECDLVIGHYERFVDENLDADCDITSGKIYRAVIDNERNGVYNGSTVQVVPHITDEIKRCIRLSKPDADIVIVEIGGTVGDIECHPFLEAIRQCRRDLGKNNAVYIHVTLVPYIEVSHEQKTKPTQHSVKELQNLGIQPDVIVCRSDYEIEASSKSKMSLFCNVEKDCILQSLTTDNIYEVPLRLEEQGLAGVVLRKLKLADRQPDLSSQMAFYEKKEELAKRKGGLKIAVLGKYVEKHDAYISLKEAINHSSIALDEKVSVSWLSSERIDKNLTRLSDFDGVIIPAGFGVRGFDGKVAAARYVRENGIPALMIGLGAQAALVEFARDVLCKSEAGSTEFMPDTPDPVVKSLSEKPTFRTGAKVCKIVKGSRLEKIYSASSVKERHRHKYDFNADYADEFAARGLKFSGYGLDGKVPEAFELEGNNFFVGVVFRPEFISRPSRPHPLITAFMKSCEKK